MKNMLKKIYQFASSWTGTIVIVLFIIFFVAQAFIIPSGSMKNSLLIGDFLFAKKFSYGIPLPRIPFTNTPLLPDFNGNGHLIEGKHPQRGDIVIFLDPISRKENFVKRCFGTAGDEIIFTNRGFYLHHVEGDNYIKENFAAEKIVSIAGKLWVKNPYMKNHSGIHYTNGVNTMFNMMLWENSPFLNNELPMQKQKYSELEAFEYANSSFYFQYNNPRQNGDSQSVLINIPDFNAFYFKVPENHFFMIGDNRDNSQDSRFFGSVPYSLIVGKPWFIYFSWDAEKVPRWERIGKFVSTLDH